MAEGGKPGPLAAALEELGPARAGSEAALRDVVRQHAPVGEAAAAEALALAACSGQGWDVEALAEVLRAASPGLDWALVARALDRPGFAAPDGGAFAALAAAFGRAGLPDGFPLAAVLGAPWAHPGAQLSLLRQAAAAPPEVCSWERPGLRRQEPLEGLHAGKSPTGTPNGAWACLDLYDTLAALARDVGQAAGVRHALEAPMKNCPEVLLLGLASVQEGWGPLQQVRRCRGCRGVQGSAGWGWLGGVLWVQE